MVPLVGPPLVERAVVVVEVVGEGGLENAVHDAPVVLGGAARTDVDARRGRGELLVGIDGTGQPEGPLVPETQRDGLLDALGMCAVGRTRSSASRSTALTSHPTTVT